MNQTSDRLSVWWVRRVCETLLVVAVFLAGFLTRDYFEGSDAGKELNSFSSEVGAPVATLSGESKNAAVSAGLSSERKGSGEVAVWTVTRGWVPIRCVMSGVVTLDPTRLFEVAASVTGRVDQVFLQTPGISVQAHEPLARLFCPEVMAEQRELLQALTAQKEAEGQSGGFFSRMKSNQIEKARDALRLRGLTLWQIEEIEQRGTAESYVTVLAPVSGRLIASSLRSGMYAQQGASLYTVADTTQLCVVLSVQDTDLPWLRYGQQVSLVTEAYPEMPFGGWVTTVVPSAGDHPQAAQMRVLVPNEHALLTAGMVVQAEMNCYAAGPGVVVDPNRDGQWLCSVHPESVALEMGPCPVCQRDRVSTQSLGYVQLDGTEQKPLAIPASALYAKTPTAYVTVKQPGAHLSSYQARAVELGSKMGRWYEVVAGLEEGEQVVVDGAAFAAVFSQNK